MIARPKISRNERKTTEIGAFEVGNFAPFSCPGDADAAGGRVLGSTAGGNVFVYYADHGAKGLVAMPANEKPVTAKDLQGALETMRSRDMYDRLVVYVEACESGSMFTGDLLANDTKVYATTAASGMESSWGCYCGTESKVDGKSLSTCLGDLYSVSWMENSDLDAPAETLAKQYLSLIHI